MNIFNASSAINSFGLAGIFTILFVETGLPVVIGLPGDSLLFIAGVTASGTGAKLHVHLSLWAVVIGSPIFAILGSQFGHHLGHKYGVKLFNKPNSKYFNPDRLKSAEKWMDKYGHGKMIFLGRFIPIVRHLVNPVAGIIKMSYQKFLFWNVISALVWTQGFIWAGYFLGEKLKGSVDHYILPIVAVIVILSVAPLIWEVFKEWRTRKHLS
ncbi:MAG: VTT domain-containing protein [Actinomycetes bacterium]|jgi:membrane-associated protein